MFETTIGIIGLIITGIIYIGLELSKMFWE